MTARPLLLAVALSFASVFPSVQAAEAPAASPAAAPASTVDVATLDRLIAGKMAAVDLVGVGAAILVDGEVVWSKGYGHADRARGIPYTPDTVQPVASITKTITAVAMLQAVEDGKLDLDADINDYLPFRVVNPHDPDGRITLRTLATNTSGILDRWPAYRQQYNYAGEPVEPLEDFLRSYLLPGGALYAPENFADAAVGRHYAYSNFGAAIAGLIVERAVGEPLPDYAARRIFAPLGMDATVWRLADADPATHAKLYVAQDGLTSPIEPYEGATYPDGGVRTSVADLSKLFLALMGDGSHDGGRILTADAVREMRRFQFDAQRHPDNLNLDEENEGLWWQTKFDKRFVGHGGSDPGLKVEMLARPELDVGMIVFTNTSPGGEDMAAFAQIVLGVWKQAEAMKAAAD